MNLNSRLMGVVCGLFCALSTFAQDDWKQLSLNDLSDFNAQAGNWQIVGQVVMDPERGHETPDKKKKKKRSEAPERILVTAGTGVLLNHQTETQKDNLVTAFSHGDLLLELEVMLPRGSNSGIYLQGRYEVQLLDSWGVKTPGFDDIGGIYRNWESDPETSYMGKAPLVNAAKAPGLWQTMRISFRAPRFDALGHKIQHAKILFVELNGIRIHENVELPRPTGGPLENNEVKEGPIMIQGDHGEVAFRNIRYKPMKESQVAVKDIQYEVHLGTFASPREVADSETTASGAVEQLTYQVTREKNDFGLIFSGVLDIPESDRYTFHVSVGGESRLTIDGKMISEGESSSEGTIQLMKGDHPFELIYFKNEGWRDPRLAMSVSTPSTHRKNLHTVASAPPGGSAPSPIYVEPEKKTRLLRAFLDFKGNRDQRLTHTIGVGDPGGIHYLYDLQAGNLACGWKGPFIDATPMWHDRGDGSFNPRGMVQYLFNGPSIGLLSDMDQPFSDRAEMIVSKGYEVDPISGRPAFYYLWGASKVTDVIQPDAGGKFLIRGVHIENPSDQMYLKLAEGSSITLAPNGWYTIDERYYIDPKGSSPVIRTIGAKTELLMPVSDTPINYSLIW